MKLSCCTQFLPLCIFLYQHLPCILAFWHTFPLLRSWNLKLPTTYVGRYTVYFQGYNIQCSVVCTVEQAWKGLRSTLYRECISVKNGISGKLHSSKLAQNCCSQVSQWEQFLHCEKVLYLKILVPDRPILYKIRTCNKNIVKASIDRNSFSVKRGCTAVKWVRNGVTYLLASLPLF